MVTSFLCVGAVPAPCLCCIGALRHLIRTLCRGSLLSLDKVLTSLSTLQMAVCRVTLERFVVCKSQIKIFNGKIYVAKHPEMV